MPRGPSGGMSMPSMFGKPQDAYNSTMSNTVNPALDKAMSGNLPPFLQAIMQSVRGFTGGQGIFQGMPAPTGGFNPNSGQPTPTNATIPNPTTPFAMPQQDLGAGVPRPAEATNPQGNIPGQQPSGTVDQYGKPPTPTLPTPTGRRPLGGMFAGAPGGSNMWRNFMPPPAVRGTAITDQPG